MPILRVEKIYKRFDDRYAIHEVSFGLDEGDILCFLGPSGCGKTTLLRIIAGLEQADAGEVFFDGGPLAGIPPHRRNFGMMFQEYALFPHMTVAQNVAFGLKLRKLSAVECRDRVDAMLALVGLTGFGDRKVGELSGGERQRVALARSLAPQPRLLMLDEPLAALDRALRERLARDLRSILRQVGVTAIFVTHDQAEAFAIADKVAVFHDGRLEQLAPPEELYTRPVNETVARFLGFRNILPATVRASGDAGVPDAARKTGQDVRREVPEACGAVETALGVLPCAVASAPGREVAVLVRPEGAQLQLADAVPGDSFRVTGTVVERTFLGQGYQLYLEAAPGLTLRFYLPLDPMPPANGGVASLFVKKSAVVVLEG